MSQKEAFFGVRKTIDLYDYFWYGLKGGFMIIEEFREKFLGVSTPPALSYHSNYSINFASEVIKAIHKSKLRYPQTELGMMFHQSVSREMKRLGIDPKGLKIISVQGTDLQKDSGIDGFLYHPGSSSSAVVTFSLFAIDSQRMKFLKDLYVDTWEKKDKDGVYLTYTDEDFQDDLYLEMQGYHHWYRHFHAHQSFDQFRTGDYRRFGLTRPPRHLVFTPGNMMKNRRAFAKFIAGHFVKVPSSTKQPTEVHTDLVCIAS